MRHGCGVHGARTVTTATGAGYRQTTYRELGQQPPGWRTRCASIGITGDQRVATFMWNNAEHLTAYLAVPSMGAVLHTLNIRLFPEQIAYVANEAEDRSSWSTCRWPSCSAPILGQPDTVHTVIVVGEGDLAPLHGVGQDRSCGTTR